MTDYAESHVTDFAGNIYLCGSFMGSVDFDPSTEQYLLNGPGGGFGWNGFIQKLDACSNFIWAVSLEGMQENHAVSIASDNKGYLYITGDFRATVDFDPGPGVVNRTSVGGSDIFHSGGWLDRTRSGRGFCQPGAGLCLGHGDFVSRRNL